MTVSRQAADCRGLTGRFQDEIRFFRSWIAAPKTVGAILPTSMRMARRMAALIDPASDLPVLELGPGTGIITRAILERGVRPEKLVAVEYSPEFHTRLIDAFPGVNFIRGDAFALAETLGLYRNETFGCALSGLPLLNFKPSERIAFVDSVLDRLAPGAPLVQFTYGPREPVPSRGQRYEAHRLDFVFRNFPPAHIWVYRRRAHG